jgi:hypothetical protein
MEQRLTFDAVATLYDAARPNYPEALFDDVVAAAGLNPDDAILELGCGTGQATQGFARRGCRILGLDPGADMIRSEPRRCLCPAARLRFLAMCQWASTNLCSARFNASTPHTCLRACRPRLRSGTCRAVQLPGCSKHPVSSRPSCTRAMPGAGGTAHRATPTGCARARTISSWHRRSGTRCWWRWREQSPRMAARSICATRCISIWRRAGPQSPTSSAPFWYQLHLVPRSARRARLERQGALDHGGDETYLAKWLSNKTVENMKRG